MYKIKVDNVTGRGLYATKDIKKGQVVMLCEVIQLSIIDTKICDLTVLKFYMFNYKGKSGCVVLGDGMIFNHSFKSNVDYKLVKHENRKVMRFKANRDIKANEQLCINYETDEDINIGEYFNHEANI